MKPAAELASRAAKRASTAASAGTAEAWRIISCSRMAGEVAGIGALLRPNKYSILKFVEIHPGSSYVRISPLRYQPPRKRGRVLPAG